MARTKFAPKVPLPLDRSLNPTTCLIPGHVRLMMPNGIRIRSAVFPQCTAETDAPTDRSSTGKFDDYRPLYATRATRPSNWQVRYVYVCMISGVCNVADSYCPPSVQSRVSVKPRMKTLDASVEIVVRHNLAAPTYLNDQSQRQPTNDLRHNSDELWLQ